MDCWQLLVIQADSVVDGRHMHFDIPGYVSDVYLDESLLEINKMIPARSKTLHHVSKMPGRMKLKLVEVEMWP